MYTLQTQSKALLSLPENIFFLRGTIYYYKDLPIFNGSNLTYAWPRNELHTLLLSLGYSTDTLVNSEQLRTWGIQAIFLKEFPKPRIMFKNGKIRRWVLTRFYDCRRQSKWKFDTPFMKHIITFISNNWNKISQKSKEEFSPWFDENGHFCILEPAEILLPSGETSTRLIKRHLYRLSNDLISNELGETLVLSSSPIIRTETIKSISYDFSLEEWTWFSHRFIQCSNCNTWIYKEDSLFGCCSSCTSFSLELESYSTKATEYFPEITKKHPSYSQHLLGVELEYEQKPNSNLKEILFLLHKEIGTHAIFKRDGSLTNGVEICTRPASINIHLEELLKLYSNNLIWDRLEVKSTCGMHVHIDRRKMTALSLGKLLNFIQQDSNKSFLEVIAERESNTYAQLGGNPAITSHHRGEASLRYKGLNLCNQNTAEIRIFKTPNTFETFRKNIEFVSALTSFVQPANSGIKDLNYKTFLSFVQNNSNVYKELAKFTKGNF